MDKHNKLIRKTIKAYLDKHDILYNKGFLFKNELCIFESDIDVDILNFLYGFDCGVEL